jgi:hypothetical protein
MKKWFSALFLLLVLLKIGGFVAILSIQRELIREKVIRKIARHLENEELVCIVGTSQNLANMEWEKEGTEFWFNDNLYDVVRTETMKGLVHYYCLSDNEESRLAVHIQALSQSDASSMNGVIKEILNLIFQQLIPTNDFQYEFKNSFFYSRQQSIHSISIYCFLYFSKLLDPPKAI